MEGTCGCETEGDGSGLGGREGGVGLGFVSGEEGGLGEGVGGGEGLHLGMVFECYRVVVA